MPSSIPSSKAHRASTRQTRKFATGFSLTTFSPPPDGFDPMTADPATLRDHGYPERPVEPAALAQWQALLGTPLPYFKPVITRKERPTPPVGARTTISSTNWSGAIVRFTTGPSLFTVAGRWTVPHVARFAQGDDKHVSFWVGIDGSGTPSLFQAGVHAVMSSGDDSPDVWCWIEWLPDLENSVGLPVRIGDTMACVVTRDPNILAGTVQHGQWKTIDDDHRLVAMHDGKILDWKPGDGTWRLWNYDPTAANILQGPHSQGTWDTIHDGHCLLAMHDGKVLDWVPETGAWRLWRYQPSNTQDCLPGSPVSHGTWSSLRDGHVLVPMRDGNVIDWVPDSGDWRLWKYAPGNGADCLPAPALSSGRWTSLDDDHTLLAMTDGRVLDRVDDGSWRLWPYNPDDKQDCLPAPAVAVGEWSSVDDDHTLVTMHDGRILDWTTDGTWRLFDYDAHGRSATSATIMLRNETQRVQAPFHMHAPEGVRLEGQTAEWVVERPSNSDHEPQPLADYGRCEFTHATATRVGGILVKPSAGENIAMVVDGKILSEGTAAGETVTCRFG